MPLVPALCTQCGAKLEIDSNQEAALCPHCHTPFVTENAINNYNTNYITNIGNLHADVVNISVDGKDKINNYLNLAKNAYASENLTESEEYCNKILESDVTNYEAWFLKGKTVAALSTIDNLRIAEIINSFSKSIENAPDGFKPQLRLTLVEISLGLLRIHSQSYLGYPTCNNAEIYLQNFNKITSGTISFAEKYNMTEIEQYKDSVFDIVNYSIETIWGAHIQPFAKEYRPSMDLWTDFKDTAIGIITFGESVEGISYDNEKRLKKYDLLIKISHELMWSKGYWKDYSGDSPTTHTEYLPQSSRDWLNEKIKEYEDEVLTFAPKYVWKRRRKCQHCGGSFKGVFTRICKVCGRQKDY